MFCSKCGKQIPDSAKFCGNCGNSVAGGTPAYTPKPTPVVTFPENSGETRPLDDQTPFVPQPFYYETKDKKKKSSGKKSLGAFIQKIPGKVWKIGGGVLAAVLAAVILICVFSGTGGKAGNGSGIPEGALYLKDGELYYSDYSKKAPWEITGDLLDDASNYTLRSYANYVANTIHVTSDGKTMFYMDKIDGSAGTLYMRSLSDMSKEATKIAASVSKYTVSQNGKLVLYLKNGTLYQYDMKDETKLAKDVSWYEASDDCKTVYYRNDESVLYVVKNGTSEKIGSDISIEQFSEDYSTVYYINDGKLYKKTIGQDKEKILSNVGSVVGIRENGSFYFYREQEVPLSQFFRKDGSDKDYVIESYLEDSTMDFYELGYYDGETETILADYCTRLNWGLYGDKDIHAYVRHDVDGAGTITVTDLVEYYYSGDAYYLSAAAEEMVEDLLADSGVFCVAVNGNVNETDLENVSRVRFQEDGKSLCFLCEAENAICDLYQATVSGNDLKDMTLLDEDVYLNTCFYADDGFGYFKDVNVDETEGDLYVDGVLVDSDVSIEQDWDYNPETKSILYFVDYSDSREKGTLKSWNGKSSVEVCEDACEFDILTNGDVLVAYDYSSAHNTCSIAVWNGSKLTEICEDVESLFDMTDEGQMLILTEYSSKNESYTMQLWDGKKLVDVAEDVYRATFLPNGNVLYLSDYSTSKYEGELYLFDGKKSQLVDEDVAAIVVLPGTVTHTYGYSTYYYGG